VLRDAQNFAPHQRHERLLIDSAGTAALGERLIWFFDRAFAYRISERFQTLDEFVAELARFADSSLIENLDLIEQFDILDQSVRTTDRNVQVGTLRQKYDQVRKKVIVQINKELKVLEQHHGNPSHARFEIHRFMEQNRPKLDGGDLLDIHMIDNFIVARQHFQQVACVLLVAFGVGMQIHICSASYCAPSNMPDKPNKLLTWSKIAVLDENTDDVSETKLAVIVEALKSNLAREITNLAREKTH
jgi:hypothetical protein